MDVSTISYVFDIETGHLKKMIECRPVENVAQAKIASTYKDTGYQVPPSFHVSYVYENNIPVRTVILTIESSGLINCLNV